MKQMDEGVATTSSSPPLGVAAVVIGYMIADGAGASTAAAAARAPPCGPVCA
jgi:hypothetical protein